MIFRDEHRQWRSSDLNQDSLRELMERDSCKSTQPQHIPIHNMLPLKKMSKLGVWYPHTLCEKNDEYCMLIATNLSRKRNDPFSWISWQATKNRNLWQYLTPKALLTRMELHCRLQRWNFTEEKLNYVYGGIIVVLFILSFKPLSDTQNSFIPLTAAM